jgi:hypothetical protein
MPIKLLIELYNIIDKLLLINKLLLPNLSNLIKKNNLKLSPSKILKISTIELYLL